MKAYLDASVLVPLFTDDALSARADAYLRTTGQVLVVSDLCVAEVASAIARKVRMGLLSHEEARAAFSDFDAWTPRASERIEIQTDDLRAAESFIRRLDLPLRTPDAMNIAIARRTRASLATFDDKRRMAAQILGLVAEAI